MPFDDILAPVDIPPAASAQQQQAEQMRVYWKVCSSRLSPFHVTIHIHFCFCLCYYIYRTSSMLTGVGCFSSSKACSRIWARCLWIGYRQCSSLRLVMIRLLINWPRLWKLRDGKVSLLAVMGFGDLISSFAGLDGYSKSPSSVFFCPCT